MNTPSQIRVCIPHWQGLDIVFQPRYASRWRDMILEQLGSAADILMEAAWNKLAVLKHHAQLPACCGLKRARPGPRGYCFGAIGLDKKNPPA